MHIFVVVWLIQLQVSHKNFRVCVLCVCVCVCGLHLYQYYVQQPMSLIFKHTVISLATQAASVSITMFSRLMTTNKKETLHNHTESYRAKHTAQYDFKEIILTAYGPLKKTLRTLTSIRLGTTAKSRKEKICLWATL